MDNKLIKQFEKLLSEVNELDIEEKIEVINIIKEKLTKVSPLSKEPVDCVKWVKAEDVVANDYNPNKVAPPEMKLLYTSILEDGYTQPIVVQWDKELEKYVVIDGFHRNRIGKEYQDIKERIYGYLPVVILDKDINSRMASTIRHNRARGTHQVQSMSEIVAELHFKGWSDKKIAEQLGMDKDEILRLKQFTGLGSLFASRNFSNSWE